MSTTQQQYADLEAQMKAFEDKNPKVAEALKLFDMSMATYQGALNALQSPRMTQSSSTTSKDNTHRG